MPVWFVPPLFLCFFILFIFKRVGYFCAYVARPVVCWTCVVVTARAWPESHVLSATATPCCCFIHLPRSSGPKPVKICMHLVQCECCHKGVFINQSGGGEESSTPSLGKDHSKFPTIEPFSPLTFSRVPGGKGGFPKGTASCYRSPKEDDIYKDSLPVRVTGQSDVFRVQFSPLHHDSPVLDVQLWRVCKMDKYSLQTVFYWFHVRVWTCTCLTSSVHSALN